MKEKSPPAPLCEEGGPKPPPLLPAAGLLFWGWQTGLWIPAAVMAVLLESAPLVRFRWTFSVRELNRVADLCALLFVGMAVYLFFAGRTVFVVFTLLKWLPMSLFPLVFCQVYGDRDEVDLHAVSLFLRSRRTPRPDRRPVRIGLSFPYFGLCLLSAGFANRRDGFFYLAFLALAGWALGTIRPRRHSPVSWAAMVSAAALLGFGGYQGMHRLQQYLELKGMEFFADFRGAESDPFRSITGIGDIADRKPSGRVVFRVRLLENARPPLLLREAGYNRYHDGRWFAMGNRFQTVPPRGGGDRWVLGDPPEAGRDGRIRVMASMPRPQVLLKAPTGTWKIDSLPVSFMERNELGAIRAAQGPGLIEYEVVWNPSISLDAPPMAADRELPEEEAPVADQLVRDLGLSRLAPAAAAARIGRHFEARFRYDLGVRHRKEPTYLSDFLVRSRTGHCEHFASAAVLLMRAAGIPARYAVGYSVHEYSDLEDALVARDRHAHAWAIYWDGGRWRDLDATPPDWRSMESEAASPWERLSDLWSWIEFRFQAWRWRPDREGPPLWTLWFILPLVLFLLRRLARKRRIRRNAAPPVSAAPAAPPPGLDSPFYEIERRLTMWGHARRPGEPMGRWVNRLAETPTIPEVPHDLLRLHYRYRFGPEGLPAEARERLEAGVRDWLARTPEGPPPAV